ncbi:LysR substrate-binding domain-containing protein [Planktomarina temperata]|jgi:LysR family glycine cleavage system transcriptional activator|nr:LysR substrate-binding domain-containing protein [Planktomarina temperata]MDC1334219.1 LysR substrate-binding domain-containing protein [Planktomarina temperata]
MKFRSYDSLKVFDAVARKQSMTKAATDLNLSKGSISYQINKLEENLGFALFERSNARLQLTENGRRIWNVSLNALQQIDQEIEDIRGSDTRALCIGALTYFSSRWLSPRLMDFFEKNAGFSLRIEPINSLADLKTKDVDLAILWGVGEWKEYESRLLLRLPSVPTANATIAKEVRILGIEAAVKQVPLLGDSSGDTGWRAWHRAVGLPYLPSKSSLTIPDSNSRVQAVIDGQGIALWDRLVAPEIKSGQLVELTDRKLDTSGYYLVFTKDPHATQVQAMIDWLFAQTAI